MTSGSTDANLPPEPGHWPPDTPQEFATEATADPGGPGARSASSPGVHAALAVMEQIVAVGPMSLVELSRQLGVPKSTLHRICNILLERGWAARDEEGRFEPGVRAIGLGSRAGTLPIVSGFRRAVAALMTGLDETVCLATLDGWESVFIAIEETTQPVRLLTWVGRRTPAFASASGRVLIADYPRETITARYGGQTLVTPTGRRLRSVEELNTILDGVREHGYAENHEETAEGLYCASVPIRNGEGTVLAAMTVCVPTSRMTPDRREGIIADLRSTGAAMSVDIAWLPAYSARRL